MVSANEIEVNGIQRELEKLQESLSRLKGQFQEAVSTQDADLLLSLGKQIQRTEVEIETLEKRYARETGLAIPNQKGIAASRLKDAVAGSLEPNIESIREFVRTIWSLQPEQKLKSVVLSFDPNDVTAMPTISLVGGFWRVTKTKETGRATRSVTSWMLNGEPVGRKRLILLFGPKYGQQVPFDSMSPKDREILSDAIAAGEGLEKVAND